MTLANESDRTLTPAGIEPARALTARRALVAALILGSWAGLAAVMARICGAGGWTLVDVLMFVAFLVAAPWSVIGLVNAVVGLWLLHGPGQGWRAVAGFADVPARPLSTRTAILLTIRNEDADRALSRLAIVKASLEASGEGSAFDYFALSDSDDPARIEAEEVAFARFRAREECAREEGAQSRLIYRRRPVNEGYKAGNIRDFCERFGADYEFMIPLDADSLMSGQAILRLVRTGEAWPKLGLIQTLVVGLPSQSAFARVFQFGMRHGMRLYAMGAAWWAGDCGPFWGHNALVRIKPFHAFAELPILPGPPPFGGLILSHDQVEAALLRRGGYEVRVLPIEGGSYEENPPTLIEFTRRDLRWCQGNMQYWKLLGTTGLEPMSRFQLLWAVMMFVGVPAWTLIILLAALKPFDGEGLADFPFGLAKGLYLVFMGMYLAPKLAGFLDTLLTPGGMRRYGGAGRFAIGCFVELLASFLLSAATTFRTSLFMIGLVFGKTIGWGAQARTAHALSFADAARAFWPQTLFGLALIALILAGAPSALVWAAPVIAGYPLAIPFAMLAASPSLGAFMARERLCATPEEFDAPPEVAAARDPQI